MADPPLIKSDSVETLVESSSSLPNSHDQKPEALVPAPNETLSLEEEKELHGNIQINPEPLSVTQICSSNPVQDPWNPFPSANYESDTKEEKKEEEPVRMDNEIFTFITTGVGVGLINPASSCFLNSVLQCLTHTVPFVESLRAYKPCQPCNCGNDLVASDENPGLCVVRAIRAHLEIAMMRALRSAITPFYFLNNLNYFSPDFRPSQQEDAQEFLSEFLDKLERCFVDQTRSNQNDNIVKNVFGGRLVSVLRCCKCDSLSKTFEPSLGVSLEIEDVDNLEKALESFTSMEELDEQLTCDECNEKVAKKKKLSLDKLPVVAMFHLKRFKNNGYSMEKISKHVNFPLELDLEPYMSDNEDQVGTKYSLYAFVEHLGSLGYGHYTAYVRSAPKTWHNFDDDKVTRISEYDVLSRIAYMLFYVKEGTPWFSRAFQEMQPLLAPRVLPDSVTDPSNGKLICYERSNNTCESILSKEHVKTGDNSDSPSDVSSESSSEESTDMEESDDDDIYNNLYIEKEMVVPLDVIPLAMVQNEGLFPKQQEETFEHMETENCQEEPCVQPMTSDVADSEETKTTDHDDLVRKPSPRARELVQAICKTDSPPKKFKTT